MAVLGSIAVLNKRTRRIFWHNKYHTYSSKHCIITTIRCYNNGYWYCTTIRTHSSGNMDYHFQFQLPFLFSVIQRLTLVTTTLSIHFLQPTISHMVKIYQALLPQGGFLMENSCLTSLTVFWASKTPPLPI